jgi:transcriptional regulator of aroF, aroG, tyrA and aromatic amino acid transport
MEGRIAHLRSQLKARFLSSLETSILARDSMKDIINAAKRAADANTHFLIEGGTGASRELLAQAIHYWSRRANMSLVKLDCHDLSDTILEQYLKIADGGTFVLNGISELTDGLQRKLLRVLADGVFQFQGEANPLSINVQVVGMSPSSLESEVFSGEFLNAPSERLRVCRLIIPTIRDW